MVGPGCREQVTQGRVMRGPRRLFQELLTCEAGQPSLGQPQDCRYWELAVLEAWVNLAGLLHSPGFASLVDRSRRLPSRGTGSCFPGMETLLPCSR